MHEYTFHRIHTHTYTRCVLNPIAIRSIYRHCQCAALFILMCLFFCSETDRARCNRTLSVGERWQDPLKSIGFPIRRQLFLGEMETCFELPSTRNQVSRVHRPCVRMCVVLLLVVAHVLPAKKMLVLLLLMTISWWRDGMFKRIIR